ncbi:MAG: tetratricopeptide repeat protein [Bacteroidota bacterium]
MAEVSNLIPKFIQQQYLQGRTVGQFSAYTMYIDLSGFTPLTETLMSKGTDGAEELSLILNSIFGSMVEHVYRHNGFIPYFAGDAITAIFPEGTPGVDARMLLQAGQALEAYFNEEGLKKTRFGDFRIGIKIRLSYGAVQWGIVGRQLKAFYFRGPAIDNPTQADEVDAERGIIFDQHLYGRINSEKAPVVQVVREKYYRLIEKLPPSTPPLLPSYPDLAQRAREAKLLAEFYPPAILNFDERGEFRQVISLFITFIGVDNHDALDRFAGTVLDLVDKFSGYFKEIDFGDKGGMMVIFFGAPVSYENNIDRALEFVTALQEETAGLRQSSPLQFRAGISSGLAFTGLVGGIERSQYAAVGNRVNLAARLMTQADWGHIRVDEEVARVRNFSFAPIGDTRYKGIRGNIPTYELEGRSQEGTTAFTGQMVGRREERELLTGFAQPIFDRRFAGIVCLYGEAGIGKSRLAYETKKALQSQHQINWFTCPADQILRKPFNPFTGFLKDYFQQSQDLSSKLKREHFERQHDYLLQRLATIQQPDAQQIHKELQRTQPILAALIGIPYADSLWSQLDAKGRYQNTLAALSALFIGESLLQPVVIELEDGHWFDNSSREFLKNFIQRILAYPILLLITSRYLDDGSKPLLFEPELLERNRIPRLEIDLNILDTHSLRTFAEARLGAPLSIELLQLLQRTTNGNPFYLEQVLEYFTESQLLKKEEGKWTIIDANIKVSGSINAVLMARIDRLSTLVKETVKAAAVIGREFDIPILTEIMKGNKEFSKYNGNSATVLREQIQSAEKVQIWLAMNELRYIFRHSLLREAVYSMQMGARLRELHGLIAEAIERLYANNLPEKYVDLAFHYEQAQRGEKTREYLEKAAHHAQENFQNSAALQFYQKLIPRIHDPAERARIILQQAKVLELIGEWEACEASLQKALQLAQKIEDQLLNGRAYNRIGRLSMLRGSYTQAHQYFELAQEIFENIDNLLGIAKIYGNLGHLYFRQGAYSLANDYYEKSLALSRQHRLPNSPASIVAHQGLAYMNRGAYEAGIQCLLDELVVFESRNDKPGLATLYTNLGIVYFEKGDYADALHYYEKGLTYSEELGNKQLTAIAIGCMGSVYQQQGDYAAALENFLTDLKICEEMGDKQGIAIALSLLGELRVIEGEFDLARDYLERALQLSEELNYQKGVAKVVNNLGDLYTFLADHPQAIHYYDRAIDIARRIKNQLVLGFSLVEKSEVLLRMAKLDDVRELQPECNQIAEKLGNPELLFQARLLRARLRAAENDSEAAHAILLPLLDTDLDSAERADILFELYQIETPAASYRREALQLYQALYAHSPMYRFHQRIEVLQS